MSDPSRIVGTALVAGVGGWVLENTLFGDPNRARYSALLPGVPLLPIYAAGGAAVAYLAPKLEKRHALGRAVVYGVTLTALEIVSGLVERSQGRESWDYAGSVVDVPHALAWTALAMALEQAIR